MLWIILSYYELSQVTNKINYETTAPRDTSLYIVDQYNLGSIEPHMQLQTYRYKGIRGGRGGVCACLCLSVCVCVGFIWSNKKLQQATTKCSSTNCQATACCPLTEMDKTYADRQWTALPTCRSYPRAYNNVRAFGKVDKIRQRGFKKPIVPTAASADHQLSWWGKTWTIQYRQLLCVFLIMDVTKTSRSRRAIIACIKIAYYFSTVHPPSHAFVPPPPQAPCHCNGTMHYYANKMNKDPATRLLFYHCTVYNDREN